jgi:hypothetical protein
MQNERDVLFVLLMLYIAAFTYEFYRHVLVDDAIKQHTEMDYWSCRESLNTEASRADKAERGRSYYRRAALLGEK